MSNFYFNYDTFYKYYTTESNLETDNLSPKEIWYYLKVCSRTQQPEQSFLSQRFITVHNTKIYISKIGDENNKNDGLLFTIPTQIDDKLWDFHFHFGKTTIQRNKKDINVVFFHKTIQDPQKNGKVRENCYFPQKMKINNIADIICVQEKNSKMGKKFMEDTDDFNYIKEILSRPFLKPKLSFRDALLRNKSGGGHYPNPIPREKALYERTKKYIYKKYPKHSAYRSGLLVQEYKRRFSQKYGNKNAYIGKKTKKKGLERWFSEKWVNQRGEVGYRYKNDVYRPSVRITRKTPVTYKELSLKQIQKARKTKYRKGRVSRFL